MKLIISQILYIFLILVEAPITLNYIIKMVAAPRQPCLLLNTVSTWAPNSSLFGNLSLQGLMLPKIPVITMMTVLVSQSCSPNCRTYSISFQMGIFNPCIPLLLFEGTLNVWMKYVNRKSFSSLLCCLQLAAAILSVTRVVDLCISETPTCTRFSFYYYNLY